MNSEKTLLFFQKNYRRGLFYWWSQRKIFRYLSTKIPTNHNEADLVLSIGFYDSSELFRIKNILPKSRIVGIDFLSKKVSSTAAELKPYSPKFSVFSSDLNQIDFEPSYFGSIFALNSIYFCSDYKLYFQKLRKMLKKNGYLVLQIDLERMQNIYMKNDVMFLETTSKILESSLLFSGFEKIEFFQMPFLEQDFFVIAS